MNIFNQQRQKSIAITLPPVSHGPGTSAENAADGREAYAINSSEYAQRCRKIMKLYQHLRALGVHVDFDLPRVVVIGDQSSGKSSLVEAVTGINVPRDSGTCTRCPMECTMSSDAESWSCTIGIRNEFDSTGSPSTRVETREFAVIHDKAEMELAIRRAQAAVLSPHMEPIHFFEMSATQLREFLANDSRCLRFSKNVIQINVRNPEATDLSFVDLPGLIHNAEPYLIAIVRQLVEHYIEGKKNTLVVIAMPMTDDYEKMEAVRLAKEPGADPTGSRTIGVLTKPDLLVPGSINARKTWKGVLEGRSHQTRHGYYCVRLPDDEQRAGRITKAKMDELADNFFNDTVPWNEILDRSRFGIPNLVKFTSELLIQLIEDYLPELAKAVRVGLARYRREINRLPHRPMEAPKTIIMLSMTAFCQDISDMVFGNKEKQFVQSNRSLYSTFKQEIIATTPDFRPFESTSGTSTLVAKSNTEPRSLQDVRQVIKRCITWELPKHIPFEATKILIHQYTNFWSTPAVTCFDSVFHKLSRQLEGLLDKHFGQYIFLKKYVSKVTFNERDSCRGNAMATLRKILDLETDPVFTQNFDLFNEQERHWNSHYTNVHNDGPRPETLQWEAPQEYVSSPVTNFRAPLPQITLHTFPKYQHDPAIDGGEVTWTVYDEIKVMANVQAYFHVAHKRFIDYVPLTIEHELNQNFAKRIRNALINNIFQDEQSGHINMERLLDEDPDIAKRRADLEEKISGLERIKEKVDEFLGTDAISKLSFDEGSVLLTPLTAASQAITPDVLLRTTSDEADVKNGTNAISRLSFDEESVLLTPLATASQAITPDVLLRTTSDEVGVKNAAKKGKGKKKQNVVADSSLYNLNL